MSFDGKDYPDWLNSLRGDSPLLANSEWEFIAEVRNHIIRETKTMPGLPSDKRLKKKLSTMKDNFAHVVEYLKTNSQPKEYFVNTYPAWRSVRDITILQLKEIAKSVEDDSQNCSISRGVASSASLLGGLMCLASGSGTSRILGSVLMGLGSMTSAGTSTVELDLLRRKIKGAEKIIRKDREYSEKLWNWISDVSYIQDALNTIRYIDVDINLKKTANYLYTFYKKEGNSDMLQKATINIMKHFKASPETIKEISDVVGILMAMSMLYENYRPYFHQAFEALKCNRMLSTACNMIVATVKTASAVNAGKGLQLTDSQKSKICTGIALDAISIILNSGSARSTSREAKEIVKAAEKLKEEAEVFEKLYDAMNC